MIYWQQNLITYVIVSLIDLSTRIEHSHCSTVGLAVVEREDYSFVYTYCHQWTVQGPFGHWHS